MTDVYEVAASERLAYDLGELRGMHNPRVNVEYMDLYPEYQRLMRRGYLKVTRLAFDEGRHGEVFLCFEVTDAGRAALGDQK